MGIFDIFSTSDQQAAANAETAGLNAGYSQLSDLFGQGRTALNNNYAGALGTLNQQQGTNNAGQTQLGNLLGLNGAAGDASAQNTLQNLPGYQFALNQGSQNVLRNANAAGTGMSGGTLNALQQQGQGLASQNYNNYVSQLQPFLNASNTGAANIAGTQTGQGNALNSSLMNQGNAAYGTQVGIGNAQAQAQLAGLTQSGNILGAVGGMLNPLSSMMGSASGAASSMFSDERVKDDIEPVGELFDGQTIYRYRYKGDPRHQIGLIAQEVEDTAPDAVVENLHGTPFKGVNYKRATNWAAKLGHLREAA